MCISIVCLQGFNVINFEINLILLIKPFSHMAKKLWQKFKYFENKKRLYHEIKIIFHEFLRDFSCQTLFKTWYCALINSHWQIKCFYKKLEREKNTDILDFLSFSGVWQLDLFMIMTPICMYLLYIIRWFILLNK